MGSDGALDTHISERKALGWIVTILSDELSIIDPLCENYRWWYEWKSLSAAYTYDCGMR